MNILNLPYPPSANRYWRTFKGRVVKSSEASTFIRQTQQLSKVWATEQLAGDVFMTITLHPKTTKSGEASKTRLDLDNCIKVSLDSLNGIAYGDDKQVVRMFAEIGEPWPNGGLTVTWEEA